MQEIQEKIQSISSPKQLQDCLENKSIEAAALSHCIFHMHPVMTTGLPHYPRYYVLDFASPQIQNLIEQTLEAADDSQRDTLVRFMRGVSVASQMVGRMFEGACHRLLENGGTFTLCPLSRNETRLELYLSRGMYVRASRLTQGAFDGYYYDSENSHLVLFQITIDYNHGICVSGIRQILSDLTLLDKMDQVSISMIFVVAKGMEDFKEQPFDRTEPVTLDSNISLIHVIGPKVTSALAAQRVFCVNDFITKSRTDNSLKRFSKYLALCIAQAKESPKLLERTRQIPQYRLDTLLDYKSRIE
jgi:hypothetical protein